MSFSLDAVVAETVRARFADAEIEDVTVTPDNDSDGDPILRITVVFASDMRSIEPRRFTGLTRHMRPRLEQEGEGRFPIFRFMSKKDSDWLRHEAA